MYITSILNNANDWVSCHPLISNVFFAKISSNVYSVHQRSSMLSPVDFTPSTVEFLSDTAIGINHQPSLRAQSLHVSRLVCDSDHRWHMKEFGVVLDQRLTFEKQAKVTATSCSCHAWAICHIRHWLTPEVGISYDHTFTTATHCYTVLHPAVPFRSYSSFRTLAALIVLQEPRWSHAKLQQRKLHRLLVENRITHKLVVITFKIHKTATTANLHRHLQTRSCAERRTRNYLLLKITTTKTWLLESLFWLCLNPDSTLNGLTLLTAVNTNRRINWFRSYDLFINITVIPEQQGS